MVSASLLLAAGSMQAGLAVATADGQRDSDLPLSAPLWVV